MMKYTEDGVSAMLAVQRKDGGGYDTVVCRNGGDSLCRLLNRQRRSAAAAAALVSLGSLEAIAAREEVACRRDCGEDWYDVKPVRVTTVRSLFRRARYHTTPAYLLVWMPNSRGTWRWREFEAGHYHLFVGDDDPAELTDGDGR